MDAVIPIAKLLRDEGFISKEAQAQARALLERYGLTSPRKQNIALSKVERIRAVFADELSRSCGDPDCVQLADAHLPGQEHIVVPPRHCTICGGSSQRRAARVLKMALERGGITRLIILGGTPPQHTTLRDLFAGDQVELRLIDGSTRAHSAAEAALQLAWAQLLIVWAATPLHHKVSVAYTSNAPPSLRLITIARRGVESLCRGIAEALMRHPAR
ncbi:MAG: hypothetical protein HGA45_39575 [Chloroflexales bacterium]|nr:hypothetical protein [Chloroflexales bacterium]